MKGIFIPEITAEMFKNGCLESIETLMAEGEIYDIDYQEPCEDCVSREDALMCLTGEWIELTDEVIHRFIKRIKNLPLMVLPKHIECEDCVSRQAAIDAIWDGTNMDIYTREVKECLEALPPVTPAKKVGKWVDVEPYGGCECSECGELEAGYSQYCPNCGAKMASPTGTEGSEE